MITTEDSHWSFNVQVLVSYILTEIEQIDNEKHYII